MTTALISCSRYEPKTGSTRCKYYIQGGPCELPDELMCVEWLKAHGHVVPALLPPFEGVYPSPPPPLASYSNVPAEVLERLAKAEALVDRAEAEEWDRVEKLLAERATKAGDAANCDDDTP